MASNECECPHPPGGRVICGPTQIAICKVKDGAVSSYCFDPPSGFNSVSRMQAARYQGFIFDVLSTVTEEPRWNEEPDDNLLKEALEILAGGKYDSDSTGVQISVSLPGQFFLEARDDEPAEMQA